jgi:immune inhibitor A
MSGAGTRTSKWVLVGIMTVLACCACLLLAAVVGGAAYLVYNQARSVGAVPSLVESPAPTVEVSRPPAESIPPGTEELLKSTVVPANDPYELACRLQGLCNVPETLPAPSKAYQVGDRREFWIENSDTSRNFQVGATLRYITPHSYFWVEDGVPAKDADIAALMDTFEDKIYPTDRRFFGSEWTPGVDNDPHIYVLYVRGIGASTAGYYSTPDELNPEIRKYSNAAELFVFNADNESLTNQYTYGTLAHEFQHMIHWHLDLNESSWLNEGFSELAAFLNGYSVGGMDYAYIHQPDLPLLDWTSLTDSPGITSAHYGESFLFVTYFLDRFGDKATQAVVKDPENSLTSIDDVLRQLQISDPETGQPITANDVVMDWMDTMYLNDGSIGDGRYAYHDYPNAPQASATHQIASCPDSIQNGSVNQYGAEYIRINCTGNHTVTFTGSTAAKLLPVGAHSGQYAFWSNKGDSSDMKLTRAFDFADVQAPIEFSYWTWYDIEKGYDYLYLEASTDGKSWTILKTPSCTSQDLSGNSYGCGYTAKSGGGETARWIQEKVDLSAYAGESVTLRFEYVTDAALNGEGLLLDDMAIPAAGYTSGFEAGDEGWSPDGFVRVDNTLPQTFRLSLIVQGSGPTTVQSIPVGPDQTASVPISLPQGSDAVLVLTGTQRFTRLAAGYSLAVR